MGKMSRNKGASGERELARKLELALGLPKGTLYRSRQFCGAGGDHGDVLGLPDVHIEVKRTERLNLYAALDQAVSDSGNNVPVVFTRKNLQPWVAILEIENIPRFCLAIIKAMEEFSDSKQD
jgi:hypothetical protein